MPVHLHNKPLLACKWEGQVFVNLVLPFGLKLAPKIFTAVADVIEWCFCEAGVTITWIIIPYGKKILRPKNFRKMSHLSFIVD